MRVFLTAASWILLINSLFYVGFILGLSDTIENYKFKQLNKDLEEHLQNAATLFKGLSEEQWQPTAYAFQSKTATGVNVYNLKNTEVSPELREMLADPVNKDGVIDPYTPYIYLPLGNSHVLEIGPITISNWQSFLGELLLIGFASLSSILTLLWLSRWQQQRIARTNRIIAESHYGDSTSQAQSLNQVPNQIQQLLQNIEQSDSAYQQRIINQQDLLHGVAHEFRSPMARMQFALDMLSDADAEESEKLKQQIENNLQELDHLVKELLSYSRIKSQNTQLEQQDVELNLLIQDCFSSLTQLYPETQFSSSVTTPISVKGDETLLKRALINILRNAARYAQSQVNIEHTIDNSILELEINDDGPGIPPGKRERIFEPFTRLDNSRSRDSGGSGLGLAITKAILDKHQVAINVESNPLGGASFHLRFNNFSTSTEEV